MGLRRGPGGDGLTSFMPHYELIAAQDAADASDRVAQCWIAIERIWVFAIELTTGARIFRMIDESVMEWKYAGEMADHWVQRNIQNRKRARDLGLKRHRDGQQAREAKRRRLSVVGK